MQKEDFPGKYIGLGHLMLEKSLTENPSDNLPPKFLPEENLGKYVPAVELIQKKSLIEPEIDPEASRATTQFIDHYRNQIVLNGSEFKSHIPDNEIATRNVRARVKDKPPGPYESVTVGQDKHRILRIIPSENNPQDMKILLRQEYCVAQKNQRHGLEHNGTSKYDDSTKQKDISLYSSAKYFDQLTNIDVVTDEIIYADHGDEVISLQQFEERVLSDGLNSITDGELIAAVAVQKYRTEMVGKPILNGEVKAYLADYLKKIVSLPYNGGNPWYEIRDSNDEMLAETQQYVATSTDESISIIVFTGKGEPRIQLQYERSPAQYYCRVLVAAGGGKEIDQDTSGAALAEAEAEVGAYLDKDKIIKLGGKYFRSDFVTASSQAYMLINPEVKIGEFRGDELFRPEPKTFSVDEVKHLIASGLITDVGTTVAVYKALLKLENDGVLKSTKEETVIETKKQPSNEKMLDLISAQLVDPKYDALRPVLSKIPDLGLIQRNSNGPEFTQEGVQFAQLMKDGSKVILENAKSFDEYREMMSLFLEIIESSASFKMLGINREQLDQLRTVYSKIIGDTINLFQNIRGQDFTETEADNINSLKAEAQGKASIPGSKHAIEIVQVLEPTISPEQAGRRVEELSNTTTIQDLYKITAEALGYSERVFPKNGVTLLENLLTQKTNNPNGAEVLKYIQYLPEKDMAKLADILLRSANETSEAKITQSDRTRFAVLDGIHLSWAASRGLLSKEKLDANQYTPLPALLLKKYQERMAELNPSFEKPRETDIDQAILVAVIELMKDLIYLEV